MKIDPDVKRFLRYQSVIDVLYAKSSFHKPEIYEAFKTEKPQFIGRVIKELIMDGYLISSGPKTKSQYYGQRRKMSSIQVAGLINVFLHPLLSDPLL